MLKESVSFTKKASRKPISENLRILVRPDILVPLAISAKFERKCLCSTD